MFSHVTCGSLVRSGPFGVAVFIDHLRTCEGIGNIGWEPANTTEVSFQFAARCSSRKHLQRYFSLWCLDLNQI